MFHIDVTSEDIRLIAYETEHQVQGTMTVMLHNVTDGLAHMILNVPFCDVEKLVHGMICCHGGDAPAESYPHLEDLLKGCPNECRPIP